MGPFKIYVAPGVGGMVSFAINYYGGGRGGSDSSFVMQQSFFRDVSFLQIRHLNLLRRVAFRQKPFFKGPSD